MKILFRHIVPGAFIHGIRAEDITVEYWQTLTKEQQQAVKNSNIYEAVKPPKEKDGK